MKYFMILNLAPYISEFFAILSKAALENNDEVILYVSSKAAEEKYLSLFPKTVKIIRSWKINASEVDILKTNNKSNFSWKILYPTWDRLQSHYSLFKFNFDVSRKLVVDMYKKLYYTLSSEMPDVILQEPPANLLTMLAKMLSKELKIPYIGLISSRIPGYIDIWDNFYTNSRYMYDFYQGISVKAIDNYNIIVENFITSKLKPEYLKSDINNLHKESFFRRYLTKIKKESMVRYKVLFRYMKCKSQKIIDYESSSFIRRTWIGPVHFAKRKLRAKIFKNIFDFPSSSDIYYLFPLHLQPEASTSVQAIFYSDLISTIQYISFLLPFPYKLYVKEHPSAIGTRPYSFYKKLKDIPNVQLISPSIPNYKLIENSKGIITLTSTLGLESALLGKETYVLGNVFYEFHPKVIEIHSFKDLEEILLKKVLINDRKFSTNLNLKEINAKFMYAYLNNAVRGSIIDRKIEYKEFREKIKNLINFKLKE